jgi:hypothetical protein
LKKKYFSSHKLPKQQSTNFWSQGILGVKDKNALHLQQEVVFLVTNGKPCRRRKCKDNSALTCYGYQWTYEKIGF